MPLMNKIKTILLASLFFLSISCAHKNRTVEKHEFAVTVLNSIEAKGAAITLSELYKDPERWRKLIADIRNGSPDGFTIAEKLHHFSDAGISEELSIAVGEGVFNSPEVGFDFLSKTREFGTEEVCGNIDDRFATTIDEEKKEIARRKTVLLELKDTKHKALKNKCLKALSELESNAPWAFGEGHSQY